MNAGTESGKCSGAHLDLYQRKIICGVLRHDPRSYLRSKAERDPDGSAILNDMSIGYHVAVGEMKNPVPISLFLVRLFGAGTGDVCCGGNSGSCGTAAAIVCRGNGGVRDNPNSILARNISDMRVASRSRAKLHSPKKSSCIQLTVNPIIPDGIAW